MFNFDYLYAIFVFSMYGSMFGWVIIYNSKDITYFILNIIRFIFRMKRPRINYSLYLGTTDFSKK